MCSKVFALEQLLRYISDRFQDIQRVWYNTSFWSGRGLKLTFIGTSLYLTCVVEILLLGRAGSLPSYARILSGLKKVILAGCRQTNEKHPSAGGPFLK